MLFLEKDLSVRFYNPRLRNKKQRPSRSLFFVAQKNSRRVVVREGGELERARDDGGADDLCYHDNRETKHRVIACDQLECEEFDGEQGCSRNGKHHEGGIRRKFDDQSLDVAKDRELCES